MNEFGKGHGFSQLQNTRTGGGWPAPLFTGPRHFRARLLALLGDSGQLPLLPNSPWLLCIPCIPCVSCGHQAALYCCLPFENDLRHCAVAKPRAPPATPRHEPDRGRPADWAVRDKSQEVTHPERWTPCLYSNVPWPTALPWSALRCKRPSAVNIATWC